MTDVLNAPLRAFVPVHAMEVAHFLNDRGMIEFRLGSRDGPFFDLEITPDHMRALAEWFGITLAYLDLPPLDPAKMARYPHV